MKKKLIALLVLFNSNLIINSYTAVNKQASDQEIFDKKIVDLADPDTPIIESTINAFIAQITISTMSNSDKQVYFEKLSKTLEARGLSKTVEEIQAISKGYAQEGTQKDINLLIERLLAKDLTKEQFDEILKVFNIPTLAVARLVTDQNVIAKTKIFLDKIKEVGDANIWAYNSISEKEQEFLQKAKPEYQILVAAKNSLDTQYQTLFEAKLAALGKESLGDDTKTAEVKSFLQDLGSFTAEQKEAIYKYCTTLETVSYLPDGTINPASPSGQLQASLGDVLNADMQINLDLFKSFSVESRQAEIEKSFSIKNLTKSDLLEVWKRAIDELNTKQGLLDQATKAYHDPENIAKAQKEIAEINKKLDPFVENLKTPNLLSAEEKLQEKGLIKEFNDLEVKWQNQGILDKLSDSLEPLNTKLIEYYALNLSFNSDFRDSNAFFKANQSKIFEKVKGFSKIEDLQQKFKERRMAAIAQAAADKAAAIAADTATKAAADTATKAAAEAAPEFVTAKKILQRNVEKFNSKEINESEFETRFISLLRHWQEQDILKDLEKTPEYNEFKLKYEEVRKAKEAQKEAEKLSAEFQKEQQAKIAAAAEQQAKITAAAAEQQAKITAAADKAAADEAAAIATELKSKEIAIKKTISKKLTVDDKAFYNENKSEIDDLIVKLNDIKAKIVAGEAPNKMQEYQDFFPARVFGDGTDDKSIKTEFINKVRDLYALKVRQDGAAQATATAVADRAAAAAAAAAADRADRADRAAAANRAEAAELAKRVQTEQQKQQQKTEQERIAAEQNSSRAE